MTARLVAVLASAALLASGFTVANVLPAAAVGDETTISLANQARAIEGPGPVKFDASMSTVSTASANQMAVSQLFAQLVVATPSITAYERSYFEHWVDADSNGCDTRHEVLIAESITPVVRGTGCTITSGTWFSWYDGVTWTDPSDVDIDHMVPLSEAWDSGADRWTATQRRDFANDVTLDVALEAVTDNVNQSKGASDPASWLPPDVDVQCRYVTSWILVKFRWGLTIDGAERSVLSDILTGECGAALVVAPSTANTMSALPEPGVVRLSGSNRYATAVAISQQYQPEVDAVYVATGTNYPDALSAAPAAAKQGGPLLLTPPTGLPNSVRAEILRLQPSLIVVVGGAGVLSSTIYAQLSALAPNIRRDGGANRYETSRIVIDRAFPEGASKAFFATGANFPDALSASAAAGTTGSPVFLVNGLAGGVDSATASLIQKLGVTSAVIAGGTGVVSSQVERSLRAQPSVNTVVRYAGSNRYATSREINRNSFAAAPQAFFAVGTGFADALAGAALAGRNSAPLYVVPSTCVPANIVDDLTELGTTNRVILGGTGVLSNNVANLTRCGSPPPIVIPSNPGDSKNCSSFSAWVAAQNWYNNYFPHYGDVARLDSDNDGIVCESLPGAPPSP
ncbi:cell wall-binding repeat-containing protein [Salinibacterium sp. TMP30]|uniref:cell wall-binding repeat-containing protein n=1 Tax=Salinibacterium sp. TMP30 TaxID=3138237 RepID=UPI00313927F9